MSRDKIFAKLLVKFVLLASPLWLGFGLFLELTRVDRMKTMSDTVLTGVVSQVNAGSAATRRVFVVVDGREYQVYGTPLTVSEGDTVKVGIYEGSCQYFDGNTEFSILRYSVACLTVTAIFAICLAPACYVGASNIKEREVTA